MKSLILILILLLGPNAFGGSWNSKNADSGLLNDSAHFEGYLISQNESDVYDPFVDYSEFEEVTDEEADINFFRNGRFFTLGFMGGYRTFTDTLGEIFDDGTTMGLFLSYFFDLRFALQLSFMTGTHNLSFTSNDIEVNGSAAYTGVGLDLKYYFNTQNVTRGLAQFNPYLIAGFSQITRTAIREGESAFSKETATGFDLGAGIEIPMMRGKMYFGAQLMYQLVNFQDENTEIVLSGNQGTGLTPSGDIVNGVLILGVNF